MENNFMSVLNMLLDERCECYGVRNTICWLLDAGLTKEELLDLLFYEEDVDYVIAHPNEDYDCK